MNRRQFLKSASALAATSVLAGISIPHVFAAEDNTIRVALVGCGGRGSGAVANALATRSGPIKLVAIADLFQSQIDAHYPHIKKYFTDAADVPKDQMFAGFDAYRKAMDCLRPSDLVIMATPPAFRWVHFKYAIAKS